MPDRRKLTRLVVASLVAVGVAAPAAGAAPMPADDGAFKFAKSAVMDMHASTVHPPAAPLQDLRTENSIAPSRAAFHAQPKLDLRTEAAADPSRAPEPPLGLPTWPVDPKPIVPAAPVQPVATDGDGIDIEWPIAALALAGALALGGGLAFAGTRLRTAQ